MGFVGSQTKPNVRTGQVLFANVRHGLRASLAPVAAQTGGVGHPHIGMEDNQLVTERAATSDAHTRHGRMRLRVCGRHSRGCSGCGRRPPALTGRPAAAKAERGVRPATNSLGAAVLRRRASLALASSREAQGRPTAGRPGRQGSSRRQMPCAEGTWPWLPVGVRPRCAHLPQTRTPPKGTGSCCSLPARGCPRRACHTTTMAQNAMRCHTGQRQVATLVCWPW